MLTFISCGGGGTSGTSTGGSPPPPPPTIVKGHGGSSAIPGFLALTGTVEAQGTASVVISGVYSGFCTSPYVSAQPTAVILYGGGAFLATSGSNSAVACTNNGFFGGTGVTPGEGAAATAAGLGQAPPIIGNGTLNGLVAIDAPSSKPTSPQSGLVEVWIVRAGQALSTGVNCTIGMSNRCEDAANSFNVEDGDVLVLTITSQPGDALQNLQVFAVKQ